MDPISALIVEVISSLLSALVSVVVFLPILLMFSWSLPNDKAPGFKLRTFLAGQLIFWGSLVFAAIVDPRSAGEFVENPISFIFNLVLIVYATGIGMRVAMRIRDALRGKPIPDSKDLDELEKPIKAGEKARDIASKIVDTLK